MPTSDSTLHQADRLATPLSVYVHLPWCISKCPYCDFNSHRVPAQLPETNYVDALLADWHFASTGETRPIASVFIGGGTPSLFSPASINRILTALDRHPGLATDCEITLEANPGTRERTNFVDLKSAGVNRISLGIQSLNADSLKALGRIHGPEEGLAAINDVRRAGIDHLNCDLMFGLPHQSLHGALSDLDQLLACEPGHISHYQLTLEPGTPFHKHPPSRPDDDTLADMADLSAARLRDAGYTQYEVSAWHGDHICRHNDNYWQFGDYLAIGAGAHSKQTLTDGRIQRTDRRRWPAGYMRHAGSADGIAHSRTLSPPEARFEALLNGLRRTDGINRLIYEQRTGLEWQALLEALSTPIKQQLIVATPHALHASDRGWPFLDSIVSELLP